MADWASDQGLSIELPPPQKNPGVRNPRGVSNMDTSRCARQHGQLVLQYIPDRIEIQKWNFILSGIRCTWGTTFWRIWTSTPELTAKNNWKKTKNLERLIVNQNTLILWKITYRRLKLEFAAWNEPRRCGRCNSGSTGVLIIPSHKSKSTFFDIFLVKFVQNAYFGPDFDHPLYNSQKLKKDANFPAPEIFHIFRGVFRVLFVTPR